MIKKAKKKRFSDSAAIFLVSRAQRPITLEAEVAHAQIAKFLKDYEEWTGARLKWSKLADDGHVVDCGQGKWGSEYRIYFVKDQIVMNQLERYGFLVEDGNVRHKGTFRVNSKELFEQLVSSNGFRLGPNI